MELVGYQVVGIRSFAIAVALDGPSRQKPDIDPALFDKIEVVAGGILLMLSVL